jgi:hypothetical protein
MNGEYRAHFVVSGFGVNTRTGIYIGWFTEAASWARALRALLNKTSEIYRNYVYPLKSRITETCSLIGRYSASLNEFRSIPITSV